MSTINVYTRREDFVNRNPKSFQFTKKAAILSDYDIHEYELAGFQIYGLDYHLNNPNANFALASMTIPAYFNEARKDISGERIDTHGLFLVNIGDPDYAKNFFLDEMIFGPFGCPKRVLTADPTDTSEKDFSVFFTFNKMRFYPFVMTDFTIGYFVCDNTSMPGTEPRNAWDVYTPNEKGVALDAPVSYDATLGLYVTRASKIII